MQKSHWDGSELPRWWQSRPSAAKSQVIAFLQGRTLTPPLWWAPMSQDERLAVVLHLCAVGSVNGREHKRVRQYGLTTFTATRKAESGKLNVMLDIETSPFNSARADVLAFRDRYPKPYLVFDESTRLKGMLYPSPNGGKRILPSIYTRLRDTWLRANGVYNEPAKMNQGHLKNTVALLNESHVNLIDKMTAMLGRMHNHLGNRPDLQAKLVDLFHDFEALQVDELYPIVELLASYIEPEPPTLQIDTDALDWLDDDNYPF